MKIAGKSVLIKEQKVEIVGRTVLVKQREAKAVGKPALIKGSGVVNKPKVS